jgi:hypothetical protein
LYSIKGKSWNVVVVMIVPFEMPKSRPSSH